MKVYLAGQYSRRDELKRYAEELEKIGLEVTSHWVREIAPFVSGGPTGTGDNTPSHVSVMAERDISDIEVCDLFLLFTNGTDTPIVRGAHHFEAGYAYGRGKWVRTIGPRDNVFYYLPCVMNFPTWAEAFERIKRDREFEENILGY